MPSTENLRVSPRALKPDWLKVKAPRGENYTRLKRTLRELDLYTVCEEARCPNVGECWGEGTATVMILGDTCTRGCRFCAVKTGHPGGAVDPREPEHVARALTRLGLRYVVLTMVDRDDLLDGGAEHVAETVRALKHYQPELLVEALVGDFQGNRGAIGALQAAPLDVFAHNIEVTRRLTPKIRDRRCSYDQTLEVLREAKRCQPERFTKSSIMVGIGETDGEVFETMGDLRAAGVDVLTLGQYLRPSVKHAPVTRYVPPNVFEAYQREGQRMGFRFVASGPLVRSSYRAAEAFLATQVKPSGAAPHDASQRSVALPIARPDGTGAGATPLLEPARLVRRTPKL